jgi:hypothetical protein
MKNSKPTKSFSFQVAKSASTKKQSLKAREGVALAGCSDPSGFGDFRARTRFGDNGIFC